MKSICENGEVADQSKPALSVQELGAIYEEVVGYNLHEDDPKMTAPEMVALMKDYDDEIDVKNRPFQSKGVY